ncbi:MAG: hypothetical protein CMJ39_08420 [Phycisphaerae bacterium]|nr:hypothetical protein [Phycisphaerae bacterium]
MTSQRTSSEPNQRVDAGTRRNPLQWLLDLFSNVKFGIFLLLLLFVYSGIGSAGLPLQFAIWEPGAWTAVRTWRIFEMTEYEWFNWWPFIVLNALTCLAIIVTTLRKIPFSVLNLGVWMVHTGLIIMALGCVFYFATKIEGDVPLARGRVLIQAPGIEPISMRTRPGSSIEVTTPSGPYRFQIIGTDPNWELLSGEDVGKKAYAVKLMIQTPREQFIRQVLAGYPEYTEDMVQSNDPQQPWARSIKQNGTALVDETLEVTLQPEIQNRFWVMNSAAIYVREVMPGPNGRTVPLTRWIERPIEGLPRYREYIQFKEDVWLPEGNDAVDTGSLLLEIPSVDEKDPIRSMDLQVTSYLPYAGLESRDTPGGTVLNPVANLSLDTSNGRSVKHRMFAFDENPTSPDPTLMRFIWVGEEDEMDALLNPEGPRLQFGVPAADVMVEVPITGYVELDPDTPWTAIEGTDYSFRVRRVDNDIQIRGRSLDMARVELRNSNRSWLRWAFDNPSMNGDFELDGPTDHQVAADRVVDESINTTYLAPVGPPAPVTLVAGPGESQLRLVSTLSPGPPQVSDVTVGEPLELGPDVAMTVGTYDSRMQMEQRPRVVATRARQPRAGGQLSMIKVRMPGEAGQSSRSAWLSYHHYPFENDLDLLHRFRYQPTLMTLPDGRMIELLYSRRSAPLPSNVELTGFDVQSHVGGFTGEVSSVLNWISNIRFEDESGEQLAAVSVNDPKERHGYWYFQAQWDPPEQATGAGQMGSPGLNYTILGVGNRNGVWTMLFGSVLSVIGMLYAFYVKPMIRRRQTMAVYESMGGASS